MIIRDETVDKIVQFLETCGEADIEAGIGALFGIGGADSQAAFRAGIKAALPTFEFRMEGGVGNETKRSGL